MTNTSEDALAFISDLHMAHICCEILLEVMSNKDKVTEKRWIHEKALWDSANIALRRAFNSSRPMGPNGGKREYIVKRNDASSVLEDNGWQPNGGRNFDYFYAIGDKTVAHGNKEPGKYEVLNEDGTLTLIIKSPEINEIKEFQEMCITLECFARVQSGLDPEVDLSGPEADLKKPEIS